MSKRQDYECWLCPTFESRKSDLKHHLISAHDRLRIVCPWCLGRETTFRKAVDLKLHIKNAHKTVRRDAPSDAFGEPACFWISIFPRDYAKTITPASPTCTEAQFLRNAVERWLPTLGTKYSRSLSQWKEGWSVVSPPLLSPSPAPVLDFEEEDRAAMKIHELSITQKVHALVYEEGDSIVTWFKVELTGKLLSMQRERESLFRRLMRLQPFYGEVPKQLKELDTSSLQLIGKRICKVLGVEERFMVNAARNIMSKFGQPNPPKRPKLSMTIPEGPIQPVVCLPATSSPVPVPIPSTFIDCSGTNDVCPSASVPSASVPSASIPSASVPSASVPSASVPTASVPSASVPTASVPSVLVPSASVPSASVPSASVPSASVPSTSVPSASVPSASVPSASVPSASVPSASVSPASVPSASVPSASVPSASVPSASVPSASVPSTSVPSASVLSASVPSASVPSASVPSASVSSALVPSASVPSASVPSASVPSASVPTASVPSVGPTTQISTVTTPELASIPTEGSSTESLDQTRPEVEDQQEEVSAQDLTLPGSGYSESQPQEPQLEARPLSHAEEPSANLQCRPAATMTPSGDNGESFYEPEGPRNLDSIYKPTPRRQLMTVLAPSDLPTRAEALLKFGCMRLCPPARRNWTTEEEIALPSSSPFSRWPPKGWFTLSRNAKLLAWETVATSLAIQDGATDLERGDILDSYNFLALPGSRHPQLVSNLQSARYFNYKCLADIIHARPSPNSEPFVTQLEAAKSRSPFSPTTYTILQEIERKGIVLRL